jgi:hypothetical protein
MAKLKKTRKGIKIQITPAADYFIEWDRCDSKDKILEWVFHLTEKSWCTVEILGQLIEEAANHHKMDIFDSAA